ncbi:MAG: serine hydrolase domain-containing protein [Actinomycetota bacterium]
MRLGRMIPLVAALLLAVACGGSADEAAPSNESESGSSVSLSTTTAPPTTTTTTVATTTTTTTTTVPAVDPAAVQAAIEAELASASGTTALAERMAELEVPGLAVAVVVDGEVVLTFGAGTTPAGSPMTAATISQVGSVSKPVAALVALAVAAEGDVDLDRDVEEILTSYVLPAGAQTADAPVTLSGLLAHDAGTNVDGFLGYGSAADAPDRPALLAGDGNTAALAVEAEPGSGFRYSGGGYELAAQVVEDALADEWGSIADRVVFAPVGMADTFSATSLSDEQAARATEGSVGGNALGNRWQAHPEQAAAGLWTTADDLGALLAAFSRSLQGSDAEFLSPEWARRAVTPMATADGIGATAQGFFVDDPATPTRWFHGGRNIGYTAEVAGAIDGSYAVAVITNAFPGGTDVAREIIATVEASLG